MATWSAAVSCEELNWRPYPVRSLNRCAARRAHQRAHPSVRGLAGDGPERLRYCVAVALLEWATFAATSAGTTVGEMTSTVANGAVMAEEETERVEAEVAGETRH